MWGLCRPKLMMAATSTEYISFDCNARESRGCGLCGPMSATHHLARTVGANHTVGVVQSTRAVTASCHAHNPSGVSKFGSLQASIEHRYDSPGIHQARRSSGDK